MSFSQADRTTQQLIDLLKFPPPGSYFKRMEALS